MAEQRDPLVRAMERSWSKKAVEMAIAAERERCAKIADQHASALTNGGAINACRQIARNIRGQL